jgi:hypothetical protein
MHGRRSLNLELTPLDPDLERNIRRARRAQAEMGDNQREPGVEQHEEDRRDEEEENEEFEDARAGNGEHRRMYELDFTTALHELLNPTAVSTHSCIVLPPTNATHYDLKPHVIQMLPSFYGLDHENPYSHVKKFRSITATTKFQNFSEESVNLRLFPFSLHDRATEWLDSLPPRSITTWKELLKQFYHRFYPMSRVNDARKEISSFSQEEDEKFTECWTRFKDMLMKCPPHGYEKWRLVQFFYQGLSQPNRSMIELLNGGAFLNLTGDLAYKALEKIAANTQIWDFTSSRDKSARKKGGVLELNAEQELTQRMDAIVKRLDAMSMEKPVKTVNTIPVESCSVCASPMHLAQNCPSMAVFSEMEQVNAFNNFQKQSTGPYSETYNPGWRNHPNFSWKQNQPTNQGGFPPTYQNPGRLAQPASSSYQAPTQLPTSSTQSLEESMKEFMKMTGQAISDIRHSTMVNTQAISKLETQVGQLANHMGERDKGKLPSQPVNNPRACTIGSAPNQEHAHAIVTLRSGKQVDNQVKEPEVVDEAVPAADHAEQEETKSDDKEKKDAEPSTVTPIVKDLTRSFVPKAPYPERLRAPKKNAQFAEILEVFKQVQINIPFLDAIQQVPAYAKFLKDLVTIKRKTNVPKKAYLTEQVSSILQCKLPIKYKDPGCPTIACMIGESQINRALLDLGASVNLLPYSVYLKLGLGELKPTTVTLQLADRSLKRPRGILEDVLIKVDKFYFPVDFIVIDTEPVHDVANQIPVILGRPFLATANALINCRTGVMKISFGNMTVELNIFNINSQPLEYDETHPMYFIEEITGDFDFEDPEMECFTQDLDLDRLIRLALHEPSLEDPDIECFALFGGHLSEPLQLDEPTYELSLEHPELECFTQDGGNIHFGRILEPTDEVVEPGLEEIELEIFAQLGDVQYFDEVVELLPFFIDPISESHLESGKTMDLVLPIIYSSTFESSDITAESKLFALIHMRPRRPRWTLGRNDCFPSPFFDHLRSVVAGHLSLTIDYPSCNHHPFDPGKIVPTILGTSVFVST